jgi:hypothetical protein
MAQLDGNAKAVKMLINNDLQNNVNGSLAEGQMFFYFDYTGSSTGSD